MASSPDNFESLEKLLRLKRQEPPPPRYFNDFSSRVISRIQRGEGRGSWWERFGFDLRPALAAGVGAVACGLIVYGVATTDGEAGGIGVDSMNFAASPATQRTLLTESDRSISVNSTNPVPDYGTPVDHHMFPQIVPVGFQAAH